MRFLLTYFKTVYGGNKQQREWLRTQADERGRFPPHRSRLGNAIWTAFIVGIPIGLVMWIAQVSVSIRGPFAIAWALVGLAMATRQYRWLKTNTEFQALA